MNINRFFLIYYFDIDIFVLGEIKFLYSILEFFNITIVSFWGQFLPYTVIYTLCFASGFNGRAETRRAWQVNNNIERERLTEEVIVTENQLDI